MNEFIPIIDRAALARCLFQDACKQELMRKIGDESEDPLPGIAARCVSAADLLIAELAKPPQTEPLTPENYDELVRIAVGKSPFETILLPPRMNAETWLRQIAKLPREVGAL